MRKDTLLGRFGFMLLATAFVLAPALGGTALSAGYPDRTITLIVPYAPGGVTDLGARALAEAMEKHLKKSVVIVNKPGGGTTIGGNAVVTAKPDGYTLGVFPSIREHPGSLHVLL